jgi:hypothetical protein
MRRYFVFEKISESAAIVTTGAVVFFFCDEAGSTEKIIKNRNKYLISSIMKSKFTTFFLSAVSFAPSRLNEVTLKAIN